MIYGAYLIDFSNFIPRIVIFKSLFSKFVQPSGFGVGVNLLIPKLLAQFVQQMPDRADFLRLQIFDGRLDFSNRAHGKSLIQQ